MSLFKKKVKPIKQDCHYMSNDNGLLVILDLLETRPCYDSTWRVEVHKNGKMVANATIVRQIEETQRNLDNEIRKIIDSRYSECTRLLKENLDKLHVIAQALIEKEKIDGEEFEQLFTSI